MPELEERISAFERLGAYLLRAGQENLTGQEKKLAQRENKLQKLISESFLSNPWFTPEFAAQACRSTGESLTGDKLRTWLAPYREKLYRQTGCRNIGVVMAGNIPLVGFHDFLCVLMSGNRITGKLSSDDNQLLPHLAEKLIEFDPGFRDMIQLTESKLEGFDAMIATGSNNTSRYFEYYFGKYPHIIRKNRNGIAVLTGNERPADLENLGRDVFLYFGLGCRNVSRLFIPENYSFEPLLKAFEKFRFLADHHKYHNNYEYYKSIFLIRGDDHLDNGFVLLKKGDSFASPPAVLFYEEYNDPRKLWKKIEASRHLIQCVVGDSELFHGAVKFGKAQEPEIWDYADGIDTMEFLLSLK
jgi:hypothetical protein